MNNLRELIMKEIDMGTKTRGKFRLVPIIDIYFNTDHRFALNYVRDYIWFDDNSYNKQKGKKE